MCLTDADAGKLIAGGFFIYAILHVKIQFFQTLLSAS